MSNPVLNGNLENLVHPIYSGNEWIGFDLSIMSSLVLTEPVTAQIRVSDIIVQ